jgi:hypothetical protein
MKFTQQKTFPFYWTPTLADAVSNKADDLQELSIHILRKLTYSDDILHKTHIFWHIIKTHVCPLTLLTLFLNFVFCYLITSIFTDVSI